MLTIASAQRVPESIKVNRISTALAIKDKEAGAAEVNQH
jgi:hypothetical protein